MAAHVAGPPMHAFDARMDAGSGSRSTLVATTMTTQCTATMIARNASMAGASGRARLEKEPALAPMMEKNSAINAPPICAAPAKGDGSVGLLRKNLLPAMAVAAAMRAVNMRVRLCNCSVAASHLPPAQATAAPASSRLMLSAVTPLAPAAGLGAMFMLFPGLLAVVDAVADASDGVPVRMEMSTARKAAIARLSAA